METPEQLANPECESIIRFDAEMEEFGGSQKFAVIRSGGKYFFGSVPAVEAKHHPDIVAFVQKEKNLKDEDIEILGGGFLTLFEKTIFLDRSLSSQKIGPVKIPWEELQKIVQQSVGERYTIALSE